MARGTRRGAAKLGDVLREIVGRSSRKNPSAALQALVDREWDDVAGPEIAKHTRGLGLRDGTLVVHVDSHAWAAQLSFMEEGLRQAINERLETAAVRSIRFTVTRTVSDERARAQTEADAKRRYGGDRVETTPLTAKELERIEQDAACIENERLREAAVRARVRALEWEKARKGPLGGEGGSEVP